MQTFSIMLILLGLLLILFLRPLIKRIQLVTVFEYERGLIYRKGKLERVVEAGLYWQTPFSVTVRKVDMRPTQASVPGQEVLTADGVPLRLTLLARYEIADAVQALHRSSDYTAEIHQEVQAALRQQVASAGIDDVLAKRNDLGSRLTEEVGGRLTAFGVRLLSVSVKDIIFPGELKKVFTQVVRAKQEGLAALERARGETAALRSLANAARMIDDNPNLLQLRLLQVVGESSGNTVVLGGDRSVVPVQKPSRSVPSSENERPTE